MINLSPRACSWRSLCLIALLFGSVLWVGCASAPAPLPPNISLDQPEEFEKAAFKVLSDYYCSRKSWPSAWSEVQDFQRELKGDRSEDLAWLQSVKEPQISSSRAIFVTLNYKSAQDSERRATYIAPPRCGEESEKGVVSIAAGGVVFKLPKGFELMTSSDMKSRWKSPPYPDVAWSSAEGAILAIRFGDLEIKPEELMYVGEEMSEAYESSVPQLVWLAKDSKFIDGKPVLYHEFQSDSSNGLIANVVFSGSFDGRLFALSLTGPVAELDSLRVVAKEIEQTLQLR
jgi:hypothetical protein